MKSVQKAPSASVRLSRSTRCSPLSSVHPLSLATAAKCARFVVSRSRWPCTSHPGAQGRQRRGDHRIAGQRTDTLERHRHRIVHFVELSPEEPQVSHGIALALLSAGLTVCGCSLFDLHSLERNKIGDTGAQHIDEALKINKTLTTLKCAPSFQPPQAKMRSLRG
eukprot:scaffold4613_cov129-Isochrysis_galbana.AAC.16